MCKRITIANQKGEVDRTATISNVGIGVAKQGQKVFLIDADVQEKLLSEWQKQQERRR